MSNASAVDMRDHLSRLLARQRNYRQEVRDLAGRYPYVVFYGCGAILHSIVESWTEHVGRKIDYCCDSDSRKWGQVFCGAPCLSPADLLAMKDKCAVFVTIGDFKPVYQLLKEKGFPSVNQLFKYDLVASEVLPRCNQGEVLENLCRTYDFLSDEKSQAVFGAIVNRVLGDGGDIDIMLDVCEGNQYFPADLVPLSEQERLVDIGAFNGDTVRDFAARTKGRFGQVYSFEVDAINFRAMEENVQLMPERDRVRLFNLGVWDSECDISYSIGKSQSTVGSGEGKGHVLPLDDALRGEQITMIKMDIEGAEPNGLRGARRLIQTQKPKLAICIYHDFRHLWEIPNYIKSLVPEYKIYLRHHTNLEYETVCYAIPRLNGTPRPCSSTPN
jgi:FkbM family methyltransferase